MENSPTEQITVTPASQVEPTGQEQQPQVSAEQTQETNSGANTQESATDTTAQVQNKSESGESTDDGLAKFAKSQGVDDISTLSEDAQRFLKIAHDNQKAFREKGTGPKLTEATKPQADADVATRLAHLEYERETDKFFTGKDRSLEAKMVQALDEKRKQYGDAYAAALSRDLDTLYTLAGGGAKEAPIDAEAIRREERESINRQSSASAPTAHATVQGTPQAGAIDQQWIEKEYDPRNPEHRKLVDEYYSR